MTKKQTFEKFDLRGENYILVEILKSQHTNQFTIQNTLEVILKNLILTLAHLGVEARTGSCVNFSKNQPYDYFT